MKFSPYRPYSDPEKAARKLLEIANSVEIVQDGRIYIELIKRTVPVPRERHAGGIQGGSRSGDRARLAGAARERHLSSRSRRRVPICSPDLHFLESRLSSRQPNSAFEPCIPTHGTKVPARNNWMHESARSAIA